MVNTRAGSRYGNPDYVNSGCGMGYDATMFLLEKGIRLTGTDAWSWDAPFYFTAQKWAKDHDPSIIWEGHKAGRDIGYCHLEKLHNLEALPGDGFTISCFPHKIRGASAGWTRAVAIFEESEARNAPHAARVDELRQEAGRRRGLGITPRQTSEAADAVAIFETMFKKVTGTWYVARSSRRLKKAGSG